MKQRDHRTLRGTASKPPRNIFGTIRNPNEAQKHMKMDIALEWFLNPDHLPFVAAIETGRFAQAGLEVTLIAPDDHYDGLEAVARGEIAFACNEPLHMVDAHRPDLRALGCFFETRGGILLRPDARERLLNGEPIRLASPVAGEVTDDIAREILARWVRNHGGTLAPEQLRIESAGFNHIENIKQGFDGAWLCFFNFEGIEARHHGLDLVFIGTDDVDMANFSALELFTGADFLAREPEAIDRFCTIVSESAALCRDNPQTAAELWYRHVGARPEPMMDAILADTCKRLITPLRRDPERWRAMWAQFDRLGLARIDEAAFDALYR
ncbi:MAG: ABC transporter substrate-binding protein [Halothiobacillaceae bacterium]